jgi:hypothetical protein
LARRFKTKEAAGRGHNGGPPLEEKPHVPPWGKGGIGTYFWWKKAHRAAWRAPSRQVQLMRLEKAEALGLTYEEYTLEIMERGRFLQVEDVDRVREIKAGRRRRGRE